MQCANHLKQCGLEQHNNTAAKNELLPPVVIHAARATAFGMLFPYYEQQTLWNKISANGYEKMMQDMTSWNAAAASFQGTNDYERYRLWWERLTDAERTQFSSISTWKCPTRRSGVQMSTNYAPYTEDMWMATGPVSDYAVVIVSDHNYNDAGWVSHTDCVQNGAADRQFGPLRVGWLRGNNADGKGIDYIVPRDSISYWADGASNQLVIGEKHLPMGVRNVCRTPWYQQADCSALTINARAVAGASRRFHDDGRLATGPNDYVLPPGADPNADNPDVAPYTTGYGFGSDHPGVCQFLIGDGAVKSFSNTTSMRNVLVPLGNVADGVAVSMP
jgi:hypothetical protein